MPVLFDQGTPVQIRPSLQEHTVKTAREAGWSALANGDLLRAAEEAGFDALLITDKNMRYRQNFVGRRIGCRAWQSVTGRLEDSRRNVTANGLRLTKGLAVNFRPLG